jgi:hypothetical protein
MPLAGMENVKTQTAHLSEHHYDRFDRCSRQAQIVPHAVDIAADPAEIGLHVDDDQRRIALPEVAVIGPGIRVCCDMPLLCHRQSLVLTVPITALS